jgi:hypothetical protein
MRRLRTGAWSLGLALLTAAAQGQVGDPTLRTSHRIYPGEGAMQTVEDVVELATAGQQSEQDRAISLYRWLLMHQYHLMSPQECAYPGQTVDTAKDSSERVVYDANRARFSYGYGLCGTVHAWNEPYWRALGMKARRRAFPGHTNSEVFYDGAWHAMDTDMAGLLFRKDGVIAGYEDIIADPSLVVIDPQTFFDFTAIPWVDGDDRSARRSFVEGGHVFLPVHLAEQLDVSPGSEIRLNTDEGERSFRVSGIYAAPEASPQAGVMASVHDLEFFVREASHLRPTAFVRSLPAVAPGSPRPPRRSACPSPRAARWRAWPGPRSSRGRAPGRCPSPRRLPPHPSSADP